MSAPTSNHTAVKEKKMLDQLCDNGKKIPAAKSTAPMLVADECKLEEPEDKELGNWVPQFLQSQHEDAEGIQHAAIIVALTGGVADSDTSKIEVTSTQNGCSVLVSRANIGS